MRRRSPNLSPRRRRLAVLAGITPALSISLLGIGEHYGPRMATLWRHVYDGAVIAVGVVLLGLIIANLAAARHEK